MANLNALKKVVGSELEIFDNYFKSQLKGNNFLLNLILNYILKTKGKQLRPLLVFYSAKLIDEVNEKTYVAATLVELLHSATLIHDDVVDNSFLRRGFFSIKALWGSKIAVLLGDYLLAKGLLVSVENKTYDLLEIVSDAVKQMAEGELLQIEKARKLDISEDLYFEIIKKKTAVLISASTKVGAKSVCDDEKIISLLEQIGINIGLAFQIKDDLFDYEATSKIIGKPIGNDIQEKKITLPLIYALNNVDKKEKKKILKVISKDKKSNAQINYIIDFVKQNGGVDYSRKKMYFYKDKAIEILNENFDNSKIKDSFIELINFIVNRKK